MATDREGKIEGIDLAEATEFNGINKFNPSRRVELILRRRENGI